MVAPSLVTVICLRELSSPIDCKILSMPLGPRVVFTRSAIAIAPTKDCCTRKPNIRIMFYHSRGLETEVAVKPARMRQSVSAIFETWFGRGRITYESSEFTSVLGGAFHKNLWQHVLHAEKGWVSKGREVGAHLRRPCPFQLMTLRSLFAL